MKNFLKKLHIGSIKLEDSETKGNSNRSSDDGERQLQNSKSHDNKPFSTISGWLNSVTNRHSPSPPSSSNVTRGETTEGCDSVGSGSLDAALDAIRRDSESTNSRDRDVEEEYQIQLALELSAREDPEAVQIEAVKQISLGSCPPQNTPAEVVAYRYWNYNALSYDDKILDGFYDLYGILTESTSSRMPSLIDLQGTPLSDDISWEAIIVNRAADTKLLNLEQKALEMAFKLRSHSVNIVTHVMVQKLATLVSDHMGGPVGDPDNMLIAWRNFSHNLKANHGSMVLPLGSLTIGLARHRALLFKVLADSLSIPCRLVKGQQFTGSADVAMNFVKIDGGRQVLFNWFTELSFLLNSWEYIVDLMADPGTLIPSDAAVDHKHSFLSTRPVPKDVESSFSSVITTSFEHPEVDRGSKFRESSGMGKKSVNRGERLSSVSVIPQQMKAQGGFKHYGDDLLENSSSSRLFGHPYSHARSPSWTEGVSSPAVRRMKVKDVSQYMIDAAKENPQLAQKLHDVLLESGVVAPPNLFTEMYPEQLDIIKLPTQEKEKKGSDDKHKTKQDYNSNDQAFFPPLPYRHGRGKPLEVTEHLHHDVSSDEYKKDNVPVAAAAAAAAAVVASSMVVAAAAKANSDPKLQLPVAAAATATAAAVVATTVAVNKQFENALHSPDNSTFAIFSPPVCVRNDGEADVAVYEQQGSGGGDHESSFGVVSEGERISDRSTGAESSKSDATLDDVADCEIPWEDITLGERIGLGSYGEVYRGDWHGTEVAVKKFLDQDLTGESLEEFKSEVRIMKRVRHPNVVLFMGAVTRPPNLSIITEFLPRGSLYRLIHRPNNQIDERRRLRMALDAARGMNYLHNCSPVIVHRDLKSPNLLVDKNWVVKVCDFGLSRMKHSTFLSSRSAAGTHTVILFCLLLCLCIGYCSCFHFLEDSLIAVGPITLRPLEMFACHVSPSEKVVCCDLWFEDKFKSTVPAEWMAPEVLRNEPSNEKCDVYSFGVILWELCTLQQPWGGMNPMQVVGAVGFQHRRLDIPDNMDPVVADIIRKCWQTDPKLRPSFAEIMAALKPLQKPITSSQVPRPTDKQQRV
ncbi:hypothetical protein BUALT_Bualt07G0081100 [Buddleja alternifolia]|uniref:non-specific serine/threonine protein kinase n=1 Tax=Buddleja alternifolia TaxID=168488 RepID=A0AAV6XFT0_9LAMI|nr:hypothetical protein BUALT_Bualt07G0081100 [Buddleja alternifolia]